MNSKFHGMIAFPATPTDSQGKFDARAFRLLINRLLDAGSHGIAILASTGAGAYFSEQERKEIASAAAEITKGRAPLMVGTGAMSTAEAIRLSQHAEAMGAESVITNMVSYWPVTADEVYRHFERLAHAVSISICVYNNPGTTQVDILPELAGRLSTLPHIDSFKEVSADLARITQLKQSSGGKLSVAHGRDAIACEALIAGADAWQSGIANVIPEHCVRIFNLVKKDANHALATQLAAEISEFCRFASEKGLIRSVHTALEMMGKSAGRPRPPIGLLEGSDAETLRKHLTALGLIGQGVGVGAGPR